MNKCFFTRRWNIENTVACMFIVTIGFCLMGHSAREMVAEAVSITAFLLLVLGLSVTLLGVFLYALENREYSLSPNGFSIRYLGSFVVRYDWESVRSVCICDVNHASKNYTHFDLVIRIECDTKKHGPLRTDLESLDPHRLWRKQEYNLWHYRKVILIEYSPSRLKELVGAAGINVTYSITKIAADRFAELNDSRQEPKTD